MGLKVIDLMILRNIYPWCFAQLLRTVFQSRNESWNWRQIIELFDHLLTPWFFMSLASGSLQLKSLFLCDFRAWKDRNTGTTISPNPTTNIQTIVNGNQSLETSSLWVTGVLRKKTREAHNNIIVALLKSHQPIPRYAISLGLCLSRLLLLKGHIHRRSCRLWHGAIGSTGLASLRTQCCANAGKMTSICPEPATGAKMPCPLTCPEDDNVLIVL